MKGYTSTEPVFSNSIQIVEATDPAHADNINEATKQLLQNTLILADMAIPVVINANLTNTQTYPFNDSQTTLQINPPRNYTNYRVDVEVLSVNGGAVGDIVISDKLVNGFKIAFTGSATSVSVRCHVLGGMYS